MRNAVLQLPSVAASAGKDSEKENNNGTNENESGSAQIRRTVENLRDLLLRDEYGRHHFLGCMVREGLEEIALELNQLAGMQELFESWIGGETS